MVEIGNIRNVGGTPPADRPGRAQARPADAVSGSAGGDSLEISEQARLAQEVGRLASAAKTSAELRLPVVEDARQDLAAGTLDNDAAIAASARGIIDLLT